VKLLLRLYEVDQGEILAGLGWPIRDLRLERPAAGESGRLVSQEGVFLFTAAWPKTSLRQLWGHPGGDSPCRPAG